MAEADKKGKQAVVFQGQGGRSFFSTFRSARDGQRMVAELESQGIHVIGVTSLENVRLPEADVPKNVSSLAEAKRQ